MTSRRQLSNPKGLPSIEERCTWPVRTVPSGGGGRTGHFLPGLSKFVVKKLNESIHDSWPDNFDKIFGSISDETFTVVDAMKYEYDASRETL